MVRAKCGLADDIIKVVAPDFKIDIGIRPDNGIDAICLKHTQKQHFAAGFEFVQRSIAIEWFEIAGIND